MEDILKSALMLSILSSPSKLGLWKTQSIHPGSILSRISCDQLITQDIIHQKYSRDPVKASELIFESCLKKNIRILTIWDTEYPSLLKEIHNPPLVLYLLGTIPAGKMISIVGTRNSDEKSEEITQRISGSASTLGCTIVSGMALGIDRHAHMGALLAGGRTVAVLPGGVDTIYPAKNLDIYKLILESKNSTVVSEYPPGIGTAQKWTFARRNRIISGLSESVIVIQAPIKSGAMITARYAIEQNRDLMVCPGNAFDEKYGGCHELIKQGAHIFTNMNDLFSDIDFQSTSGSLEIPVIYEVENKKCINKKITDTEKKDVEDEIAVENKILHDFTGKIEISILANLEDGFIEVDDFIRKNNFSVEEVNQGITLLEISGYIARKGNKLYKM